MSKPMVGLEQKSLVFSFKNCFVRKKNIVVIKAIFKSCKFTKMIYSNSQNNL